jgi:vacuolar-type H+-ATPase subunit E/Vma4|tara:strand:+ start:2414 stop:2770 length:357 start_codon:yes stop_codon:yes gene_type:complete
MIKPIYASEEHKTIIEAYIRMCQEFAKDVSSKSRYYNYLDVVETIIEYHNNYGSGRNENNFYDWLVIIPINLSVATNGFFAGLETNSNRAVIRAYKTVLNEMVGDVVDKIDNLEEPSE